MTRRIRVGVVSRTLLLGGAEMWLDQLMSHCDPARIEWVFCGVFDPDVTTPVMVDAIAAHCPIIPLADIMGASADVDVVLGWGTQLELVTPARPRRPKVVLAALGMCDFTRHIMCSSWHADALLAVSQVALETIPESERHKATVIPTAVDLRRVEPHHPRQEVREGWHLREGQRALVYLGRVAHEKNPLAVARTIAALHQMGHTEWRGVVVGPFTPPKYAVASLPDQTLALSEELAPGLVRFPGPCDHVGDVLGAADHMILPSFIEGSSLTLLEMWAAGVPVIATPVGMVAHEHPDWVRRIEVGARGWEMGHALLADVDDPVGTSERVHRARKLTRERYTTDALGPRWTSFLCEVAGR